jgi:hypothetical protein
VTGEVRVYKFNEKLSKYEFYKPYKNKASYKAFLKRYEKNYLMTEVFGLSKGKDSMGKTIYE